MEIKLIISDFDGTLVDTFEANYRAYSDAFNQNGISLTREHYRNCFGMRFDRFMESCGIIDEQIKNNICEAKAELYPTHFNLLRINYPLLNFIRVFHNSGGKTAIASTAREKNLINALQYIDAKNDFDIILAGESVKKGKPNPDIYLSVLKMANVSHESAIIFEDSKVGFLAAQAAGINYIPIKNNFFENGN